MTFIENSVTLKEVAAATKLTVAQVETECRELGFHIGEDWAQRPAITEADAQQLVSGEARRTRDHDAAWRSHLDACEDWTRRRDAVVEAAVVQVGAHRLSGPEVHSRAREAGTEAGRRFELSTPPPTFQGGESAAVRLYTEREQEQPGLLRRAAAAIGVG